MKFNEMFMNFFNRDSSEKIEHNPNYNQTRLNSAIRNFFPSEGVWYSFCFSRPNVLNKDYLPCHLKDYKWMAALLQKEANLDDIEIDYIESYITNSKLFNSLKDKYEKKIVKWQIKYMINGGEGWIVDSVYGGDFSGMEDQCVNKFKNGVLQTLTAIGMDKIVIENCLQEYSNIWFSKMLNQSFNNVFEYTHSFSVVNEDVIDLNICEIHKCDSEFRNAWIKLKKYEYYLENKEIIDRFGDMRDVAYLTKEEVDELRKFVDFKSSARRHAIETFKKYMYECDKSIVFDNEKPLGIKNNDGLGNLYVDINEGCSLKLK